MLKGTSKQPIINVFFLALTDKEGTVHNYGIVVLTCLLILNMFLGAISNFTLASRICFGMAVDNALPFSNCLTFVFRCSKSPYMAVLFVLVIESLFVLLAGISPTAFASVTIISSFGY